MNALRMRLANYQDEVIGTFDETTIPFKLKTVPKKYRFKPASLVPASICSQSCFRPILYDFFSSVRPEEMGSTCREKTQKDIETRLVYVKT